MEEKRVFRWIDGENIHEYRFTNRICDGFFSNDKELYNYKGRELTKTWEENLPIAGFKEILKD